MPALPVALLFDSSRAMARQSASACYSGTDRFCPGWIVAELPSSIKCLLLVLWLHFTVSVAKSWSAVLGPREMKHVIGCPCDVAFFQQSRLGVLAGPLGPLPKTSVPYFQTSMVWPRSPLWESIDKLVKRICKIKWISVVCSPSSTLIINVLFHEGWWKSCWIESLDLVKMSLEVLPRIAVWSRRIKSPYHVL